MKAGLFLVFLTVKTFNLEAGAANTPLLLSKCRDRVSVE